MPAEVTVGTIWEDSGAVLMARVLGWDGSAVQQADISTIVAHVYDLDDDSAVVTGVSQTVSSVVFNALQTDARWTKDSTGYNFRVDAPATWFPEGGKLYQVEFIFTPATGEVFPVVFHIKSKRLISS